jgi:uncharacterized protein (DUF849 family)
MIEPVDASADAAHQLAHEIYHALDRHRLSAARLQHGDGEATWAFLTDAVPRGIDTRNGLEDTLYEPRGELTSGNPALFRAARALGAGA